MDDGILARGCGITGWLAFMTGTTAPEPTLFVASMTTSRIASRWVISSFFSNALGFYSLLSFRCLSDAY